MTETQKWTLIILELNIFLKKFKANSKINQLLIIIQSDDFIMCGLYCIAFIEHMIPRKILLDYTNIFSLNDYKNNEKYMNLLKANMEKQMQALILDQKIPFRRKHV